MAWMNVFFFFSRNGDNDLLRFYGVVLVETIRLWFLPVLISSFPIYIGTKEIPDTPIKK